MTKFSPKVDVLIVSTGSLEVPTVRGGGIQEFDYQIALHLPRSLDVRIAAPFHGRFDGLVPLASNAAVDQVYFPAVKTYPPRGISKLQALASVLYSALVSLKIVSLKRKSLRVIIVDHKVTGILPALTARILGIRSIYSEGNNYPWDIYISGTRFSRIGWVLNLIAGRQMCRLVTRVRVLAPHFATAMARFGVQQSKMSPIPNGVAVETFRPQDGRDAGFVVGFLGRVVEEKGAPLLRQIITSALTELPEAKFIILGKGPLAESLSKLPNVVFSESVPRRKLPEYIARADVFLFFQRGFGLAELEVLASGKPIVTLESNDTREYLMHGDNGFLVRPTVEGYLEVLKFLKGNSQLAAEVGRKARGLAEREFSWGRIGKLWAELIEETLAES